jgi:hypothetical protein
LPDQDQNAARHQSLQLILEALATLPIHWGRQMTAHCFYGRGEPEVFFRPIH